MAEEDQTCLNTFEIVCERDPINEIFAMRGKLDMRQMTGDDWARLFP